MLQYMLSLNISVVNQEDVQLAASAASTVWYAQDALGVSYNA